MSLLPIPCEARGHDPAADHPTSQTTNLNQETWGCSIRGSLHQLHQLGHDLAGNHIGRL